MEKQRGSAREDGVTEAFPVFRSMNSEASLHNAVLAELPRDTDQGLSQGFDSYQLRALRALMHHPLQTASVLLSVHLCIPKGRESSRDTCQRWWRGVDDPAWNSGSAFPVDNMLSFISLLCRMSASTMQGCCSWVWMFSVTSMCIFHPCLHFILSWLFYKLGWQCHCFPLVLSCFGSCFNSFYKVYCPLLLNIFVCCVEFFASCRGAV